MEPKYLLFETAEVGLGHLFTAILHSAYYAWRTGRILALDMRRFHYVKENKHATFLENFGFDFPADLQILTDLDEIDRLRKIEDLHFLTMVDRLNVNNPFQQQVLLVPCVTPGLPYTLDVKRAGPQFRVVLKGKLLEEWHRAMSLPQWQGPVIGLHYRSTVGEVTERMTRELVPDYDERYLAVQKLYADTALAAAREAGYANPAFLVTSDDAAFVEGVKSRLPNAFSLATRLLDQEVIAYIRAQGHDIGILIDAVNDLWCLSECDHLVHYRSGFSEFAILNSRKLNNDTTHYVHIPAFEEILRALEPQQAVEWAGMAVRKADARRMQLPYLHQWYADALERAGDVEDAEAARRRAKWYWDSAHSPIVDTPERRRLEQQAWRGGDLAEPIANAERVVRELPGNPYVLAGYGHSLSNLLAQAGRLDEAIPLARQALELEPNDAHLHHHLGALLVRTQTFEKAEPVLRRAAELDPEFAGIQGELAGCMVRLGRLDEAIEAAREAARLEPQGQHWHRRFGTLLLQKGDLAGAEAAFRTAVELPSDGGAYIDLSNVLARQGRMDEAVAETRTAIKIDPTSSHWPARLGFLLLQTGDLEGAEAGARDAIALTSNDRELASFHELLGQIMERQGRMDDAIAEAQTAVERAPDDAGRHAALGDLLVRATRYDEAVVALRRAVELRGDEVRHRDALVSALERAERRADAAVAALEAAELTQDPYRYERAGVLFLQSERFPESEAALRDAVKLRDDQANFYHVLSIALARQQNIAEAIAAARRAAELDPGKPDRLAFVANLLLLGGESEAAEAAAREALSLNDTGPLRDLLGGILERQNRIEEAVVEAQRAVELEPDNVHRYVRLAGLLLSRGGQLEESERTLGQAIERHPDALVLRDMLSSALERQNRVEEAAEATQHALRLDQSNPQRFIRLGQLLMRARKWDAANEALTDGIARHPAEKELHVMRSRLLDQLGETGAAADSATQVIALGAATIEHYQYAGDLLLRASRPAESEATLRGGIAVHPEAVSLYAMLGAALDGLGRRQEALDLLRQALSRDDGNTDLHLRLGDLLQRAGDLDGAEREFRRAAELSPSVPAPWDRLGALDALREEQGAAPTESSDALASRVAIPEPAPVAAPAVAPTTQLAQPEPIRGRFARLMRRAQAQAFGKPPAKPETRP